jgi:YHS domain-containing protein
MNYLIAKAIFVTILFQQSVPNKSYLLIDGFVASGYDVVSYFENKPTPGKDAFITEYQQVRFKFSSAENLKIFKTNPKKYTPKYGGWCAFAIGLNGQKVSINPTNFRIFNNELFLFYKNKRSNTLNDWLKNENALYKKAELNWNKISELK